MFYYKKTTLKSVYKDMHWPADTLLVSNVAREANIIAHPWHSVPDGTSTGPFLKKASLKGPLETKLNLFMWFSGVSLKEISKQACYILNLKYGLRFLILRPSNAKMCCLFWLANRSEFYNLVLEKFLLNMGLHQRACWTNLGGPNLDLARAPAILNTSPNQKFYI